MESKIQKVGGLEFMVKSIGSVEAWNEFAKMMEEYVDKNTMKKYSARKEFELIDVASPEICFFQIIRYALRGMNGMSKPNDVQKIAHYAQFAWFLAGKNKTAEADKELLTEDEKALLEELNDFGNVDEPESKKNDGPPPQSDSPKERPTDMDSSGRPKSFELSKKQLREIIKPKEHIREIDMTDSVEGC